MSLPCPERPLYFSAPDGRLHESLSFEPLMLWILMIDSVIPCEKVMDVGDRGVRVFG